ncbi:helix-turn-helix domain-containing protein [Sporosarcina psychrophila]
MYERVVQLLSESKNIVDIHREVGISRNTIYTIKADL